MGVRNRSMWLYSETQSLRNGESKDGHPVWSGFLNNQMMFKLNSNVSEFLNAFKVDRWKLDFGIFLGFWSYLNSYFYRFLNAGKHSFNGRSLHSISSTTLNPYEQAIEILGKTLSKFDDDNLIPCFGFGDGWNQSPCIIELLKWYFF